MKIAVISDIHDHLPLLRRALSRIAETDALICCGDLCSPFIVKALGSSYPKDIYIVLGNNDGDPYLMSLRAKEFPHIHFIPNFADLTLQGKRIAVIHYDDIARPIIASGWYDVVCFGHNHRYETNTEGRTRCINPGELSGVLTGEPTFAILDTETDTVEKISLL